MAGIDFSGYSAVLVSDFGDETKKKNLPEYAGSNFADRIVSAIRGTVAFEEVTKDPQEISDNAILISGDITRYAEGNPALKAIVGFGAGSTYFDSDVSLSDYASKNVLGEISVDKNSWALGGGIAAGQSVDQFMNEAAQKIAQELVKAKNVTNEDEAVTQ